MSLGAETAARVELYMFNPTLRKPEYAARSKLIERLLNDWLDKQANPETRDAPIVEEEVAHV